MCRHFVHCLYFSNSQNICVNYICYFYRYGVFIILLSSLIFAGYKVKLSEILYICQAISNTTKLVCSPHILQEWDGYHFLIGNICLNLVKSLVIL